MEPKKTHPLLDEALIAGKLKNDVALARATGISAPVISKVRNGKSEVNDTMRVQFMRTFGWSIKKVDALAPPED